MLRVVTFGEIMMRLNPPSYERLIQCRNLEVTYAGAEANVAVSIANYGEQSVFVTKVPNNALGMAAINFIRQFGVDTSHMLIGQGRLGKYFLETGYSQRPSKVIYDRAYSAFSNSDPKDYDWENILKNATWFHFTGITPALGDNLVLSCKEALKTAKKLGVKVSCDINYREKLWSKEKANKVMTELMDYVDVLFANEEDSESVFGIKAKASNVSKGKLNLKGYEEVARKLKDKFGFEVVAITLRESVLANINRWSAVLLYGDDFYVSKKYEVHIVDRVGGGDSFAGALIYGLQKFDDPKYALEFAVGASCLKHTIKGDFNFVTRAEVERLISGDESGRVLR